MISSSFERLIAYAFVISKRLSSSKDRLISVVAFSLIARLYHFYWGSSRCIGKIALQREDPLCDYANVSSSRVGNGVRVKVIVRNRVDGTVEKVRDREG